MQGFDYLTATLQTAISSKNLNQKKNNLQKICEIEKLHIYLQLIGFLN
jgi:hypothetical protein